MKIIILVATILTAVVFVGSTIATPPGRNVEYAGGGAGRVTFDGKVHTDKGLRCIDCHPKLFQMRREAKITMADHNTNKFCFACHNGKRAFQSANNCAKCHKK